MHIPGLKVAVPATPAEAKGLLTTAIFDDDPCIVMETMSLLFKARGPVPAGYLTIPFGLADIKRSGSDITVVAWGWQVPEALAAAEELAQEGIDVEVVDPRTLVPLDRETIIRSVSKTKRALIVHAATEFAGPGAEIASILSHELFGELAAPVERMGALFAPIPYSADLETALFPNRAKIAAAIRKMC